MQQQRTEIIINTNIKIYNSNEEDRIKISNNATFDMP